MPANNAAELLQSRWRSTPATQDLDGTFRFVIGCISAPSTHREVGPRSGTRCDGRA
jgi:hypothetical protein